MPDWTVPLSDLRFSEEEIAAVAAVYRSGWLTAGPRVAAFEESFARYAGVRHAVACGSGTAALELIWAGLGIGPGDEVIVPSLTFVATAATVAQRGATPVFADILSPREPWLSPDAAAALIGPRTRAIAAMDYGGHLGTTAELRALTDRAGIVLVEDAAHALGAPGAGTLGRAGAFSFFANKNLALGEGGMLVTDDDELADRARLLRSHGLSADTWQRHGQAAPSYDVLAVGFNHRFDEARAALGSLRLASLDAAIERRRALSARYASELADVAVLREDCAWHLYPVLVDERDAVRARLAERGVQTSVHYPPLHLTTAFAGGERLPATEEYARRTMTLPLFDAMSEEQLLLVLAALR
jgi:dTDP-4-amino-4,6-dideoxygalactose transaminase